MVELKPDATTPVVAVGVNVNYQTAAGLARLIRALTVAKNWLEKREGVEKVKVTFFLPAGMVEWAVPPDAQPTFVFPHLVKSIRADGFFMAPDLYIQHAAIVGMMFSSDTVSPAIVQGMTKQ